MTLSDFLTLSETNKKNEVERAKLLCYYHYKETGETTFSMTLISELLQQSGFNSPNKSRLKDNLLKGRSRSFLLSKDKRELYFIPVVLQQLEKDFGSKWKNK